MASKDLCTMIQLHNITLHTTNKRILHNISYTYKTGTATAIIGHNGSGKTSLIKTIIGQIRPTSGTIQYKGRIAYAPDSIQFPGELTVKQIIKKQSQRNDWIAIVGLEKYINHKYKTLSQGNKQKINLINTLQQDADIYIRDEPTQHLDPQTRHVIHDIIYERKKQGKTIIYTTHFLEDIGRHTDTCIILENGKIQTIHENPENKKIQFFWKNK